ncbi:cilia- and flagella-associated protein 144-like [Liolophura sinensis]|uniref:cilia- and flagella-associated protein 144-like n=1 Tax=Liolophura sinensis TaxID=3198878 RepID=UPI003158BB50
MADTKARGPQKDPTNFVHQNAILCETITKELRHNKLYLQYHVNPFRKIHTLTGKPNSTHDSEDGEEDTHFLKVIKRAHEEPVRKYANPQTEAQEIGWITRPLIDQDRGDRRLDFRRQNTQITKYMDEAWRLKEQTENLN